ncbi:DUF3311 domain-containing protein [Blastomonas sp.]|uniref:DUF3311 domain-containing protein n=1 Tax=Blastomonas sp. TaxID=1909299 RepID=UPI002605FE60|nr:DUF3311 domain-containing protein [Blastomonas sp.]MDM7955713.1 DUF3311 domain-containing protein [Blastomonas sp.]
MTAATPAVSRRHRWLLLIPFLWQIGGIPLVNDIAWRPFSLPFPMVWQMTGIVITSLVIAFIFSIDRRHPEFEGPDDNASDTGNAA